MAHVEILAVIFKRPSKTETSESLNFAGERNPRNSREPDIVSPIRAASLCLVTLVQNCRVRLASRWALNFIS